jgi:hypothetical protein
MNERNELLQNVEMRYLLRKTELNGPLGPLTKEEYVLQYRVLRGSGWRWNQWKDVKRVNEDETDKQNAR